MLLLLLCYAACRLCSIGSFISAALLVVVVAHWGVCSIERLNSQQQQEQQQQLLLHNEENINVLSFTVRLGSVRVWSPALLVVFGCSAPIFLRQRPRLERACCTRTPTLCAPISLSRSLCSSLLPVLSEIALIFRTQWAHNFRYCFAWRCTSAACIVICPRREESFGSVRAKTHTLR